jgi:hypothetical protein
MPPEYIGNVVFVTTKAALPIPLLGSPTTNFVDTALNICHSIFAIDDKVIKDKIKEVTKVDDIGRLAPGGHSPQFRHWLAHLWRASHTMDLIWERDWAER